MKWNSTNKNFQNIYQQDNGCIIKDVMLSYIETED